MEFNWVEDMKKQEREIYIILAAEIDWPLCGFCRYNKCEGSACEDGWSECVHPFGTISDQMDMDSLSPKEDCWGFSPYVGVRDSADIVGIVLSNGWDSERVMWWKEDGQIKVAGIAREKVHA